MSNVRLPFPRAKIEPQKDGSILQLDATRGDSEMKKSRSTISIPHKIAAIPNFRITEDDDFRITEDNYFRILETS